MPPESLIMSQDNLPSIYFDDGGEQKLLFTLPPTKQPEMPSSLIFAMPKSGSVLLDGIMRELSTNVDVTYVSIMQEFFTLGVPDKNMPIETSEIFRSGGYCYGGFRYFPRRFDIPILSESKTILLVRDPRDMLVSHYFSMRESHPEPGKFLKTVNPKMTMREMARSMVIDQYVQYAAKTFRNFLRNYIQYLCDLHETKIFRYEDIIYDKVNWVEDIVEYIGWDVPMTTVRTIGKQFDIIPNKENTSKHVRQVHPGNYRKKLSGTAIEWLDDYFSKEMDFFNYSKDSQTKS